MTDNVHARTFFTVTNVDVIRLEMKRQKVSAADLARMTGIHGGLIGRYLRSETQVGLRNAPKIATALNITVSQVLFGVEAA